MKRHSIFLSLLVIGAHTKSCARSFSQSIQEWLPWKPLTVVTATYEHELAKGGVVSIVNTEGPITIKTWAQPKVLVEVTIASKSEDPHATFVEPLYTASGAAFKTVKTRDVSATTVKYHVLVPDYAELQLISTASGDITLHNVREYTHAHTDDGAINADNVTG